MLPVPRHAFRAYTARVLNSRVLNRIWTFCSILVLLTWVSCAGRVPDLDQATQQRPQDVSLDPLPASVQQPVPEIDDYGPEILLPAENTVDEEVARVGDRVLRKSHIYDRLLSASPETSLEVVDLLILDILVAEIALLHEIRVDPERVELLAQSEEDQVRQQVEIEFGGKVEFGSYVASTFQISLEEYRRLMRLRVAQQLYHGYAIRYPAMLEDRVQVRFLANKDSEVLKDVIERVTRGADFATLARRYSEDERTRRNGGLLAPFGAEFPHPIAEPAMKLQKGELSPVIQADVGGSPRYYLVYCLERFEKREAKFEEMREELDEDLVRHPVQRLEREAFALRYRGEMEGRKPREGR